MNNLPIMIGSAWDDKCTFDILLIIIIPYYTLIQNNKYHSQGWGIKKTFLREAHPRVESVKNYFANTIPKGRECEKTFSKWHTLP